jgi:hypothetical protein
MYGSAFRIQVKPGLDEAMHAIHKDWLQERRPEAVGFVADYALKSERTPGEWIILAIFDSEENYRKNGADPEQHQQYLSLRALLETDPEWNDGEIFVIEPASVPV